MVNNDVVLNKVATIERCVKRIQEVSINEIPAEFNPHYKNRLPFFETFLPEHP